MFSTATPLIPSPSASGTTSSSWSLPSLSSLSLPASLWPSATPSLSSTDSSSTSVQAAAASGSPSTSSQVYPSPHTCIAGADKAAAADSGAALPSPPEDSSGALGLATLSTSLSSWSNVLASSLSQLKHSTTTFLHNAAAPDHLLSTFSADANACVDGMSGPHSFIYVSVPELMQCDRALPEDADALPNSLVSDNNMQKQPSSCHEKVNIGILICSDSQRADPHALQHCPVQPLSSSLFLNVCERPFLSLVLKTTSNMQPQVMDVGARGWPTPPLSTLLRCAQEACCWLMNDPSSRSIWLVATESTANRTVLYLLVIYWLWQFCNRSTTTVGISTSIDKLFAHILNTMKQAKVTISLTASQQRSLALLRMCCDPRTAINRQPRYLDRLILTGVPFCQPENAEGQVARLYVQIFDANYRIVCTSKSRDGLKWRRGNSEESVIFDLGAFVSGDFLLRIRHIGADKRPITVGRFYMHTGQMLNEVERIISMDIDKSPSLKGIEFIDLVSHASAEHHAILEASQADFVHVVETLRGAEPVTRTLLHQDTSLALNIQAAAAHVVERPENADIALDHFIEDLIELDEGHSHDGEVDSLLEEMLDQ